MIEFSSLLWIWRSDAAGTWYFVTVPEELSGEIKAQAKKNAPEVIEKAAKAVAPRFEQIVEDFAARLSDFVTTAVCTDFPGSQSLSLLVIEKGTPGFTVGRRLEKLGWHCSDTAELSFVDVRVPVANRIGPEDTGFLAITGADSTLFRERQVQMAVRFQF